MGLVLLDYFDGVVAFPFLTIHFLFLPLLNERQEEEPDEEADNIFLRDNLLRRAACQQAEEYGNQLLPISAKVKKATVFLNPAACKGKARSLFEKNAAPILHLAGLDVTVVKTDYEGQAKKLLELMEDTDMIIVAGGDGTLQEVITGLLRREDEAVFSRIPIGFIPLGKMNSLSQSLYSTNKEQARHILNATLAIVKGETIPLDVLEIKGDKDRPVFAVSGLRWGAYRDASVKLSKYWYLGPLKDKACHLFSIFKPKHWEEVQKTAVEVTISTLNKQTDLKRTEDAMNICIEPDTISKRQFVATATRKLTDPLMCPEGSQVLQASFCKLQLPQGTQGFFSIDNEDYEAVSVDVKLLPRKLRHLVSAKLTLTKKEMQLNRGFEIGNYNPSVIQSCSR
ncbi:hypothetical protein chiPu_0014255 [Chiloscyllium punctatum]|uniref:Acylglycerol kinase, mitochondrial n=1 Tax=Chiloscyllium punctatum TaxID=137246 RepID=A0A401SZF8_CHIPU|nr:hypothetical protein [Chiloscyllium punctatum]